MTADEGTWVGRLLFGPWWLVYTGLVGPTEPHRHHAAQILLAPGTRVTDTAGEHPSPVLIAPDRRHAIGGAGAGSVVFIDPEAHGGGGLSGISVSDLAAVHGAMPASLAEAEQLVMSLTGRAATDDAPARHPATQAALDLLADAPDTPLATLAERASLSASRLSHVFRDDVGIPLRSYRRWARFLLAGDALQSGATLTGAAHRAGFADAAHLHRTFRDHFGLRPGELMRSVEWVAT